jgi:hypothetical protein
MEQRGRILGIGGVFFKSANRDQMREWYSKHLGLADTAPAPDRNREYEPTNDRRPNDAQKRPYFDSCTLNDGGIMQRPLPAIRECARLWREEQARAIDRGDAARAAHAEKCAQRFDEYWRRNSPESLGARTP